MTMTYDVTDRELSDQYTAVTRDEIPPEDLPAWLRRTYRDVELYLRRSHIEPTVPRSLVHLPRRPGRRGGGFPGAPGSPRRGRVQPPTGVHWEVYYADPAENPGPARWRTDVVIPYRVG
jgi:hypothetical protein